MNTMTTKISNIKYNKKVTTPSTQWVLFARTDTVMWVSIKTRSYEYLAE